MGWYACWQVTEMTHVNFDVKLVLQIAAFRFVLPLLHQRMLTELLKTQIKIFSVIFDVYSCHLMNESKIPK